MADEVLSELDGPLRVVTLNRPVAHQISGAVRRPD